MQINNIQNYNPKFTALRLKKGANRYLSTMPSYALSFVDKVGQDIKDTKFYNVEIDNDVYIRHIGGERYGYPHTIQHSNNILFLRARGGAFPVFKKISFDTYKEAKNAYDDIMKSETPLVKAAKITKYLDNQEIKETQNPVEQILPDDSHELIVEKLLKKYGV